jgi:hypothetical protein
LMGSKIHQSTYLDMLTLENRVLIWRLMMISLLISICESMLEPFYSN